MAPVANQLTPDCCHCSQFRARIMAVGLTLLIGLSSHGQAAQILPNPNTGTIDVSQNSSNTLSFQNLGVINIFSSVHLDNSGTLTNSNTIHGLINSVFNNMPGAVIINNSNSSFLRSQGTLNNSGLILNNYGQLQIYEGNLNNSGTLDNNGSNAFLWNTYGTLQNTGLISNRNGAKLLNDTDSAGLINKGLLSNSNYGQLLNRAYIENDSMMTNSAFASLTNQGFLLNGSSATLSNDIDGRLDNYGTLKNYTGGMITNRGTLTTYGSPGSGSVLENRGTLENWASLNNSGAIMQYGSMTNFAAATVLNNGYLLNEGTLLNLGTLDNWSTITNTGTIRNDATLNDEGTINNNGLIENLGIIHLIPGNGVAGSGIITGSGRYLQNASTAKTLVDGWLYAASFTQNSGTTRLLYTDSTVSAALIEINGGLVTGAGKLIGHVIVGPLGTIHAGNSPGTLVVNGSLDLGGSLDLDVAGPGSYSRLVISGAMNLLHGSFIDITFLNDFVPSPDDLFNLLSFGGGLSGLDDTTVRLYGLSGSLPYHWDLQGNSLSIQFSSTEAPVPEPESLWMAFLGLAVFAIGCCRRKRAPSVI